ncbi:MAG: hypothetical protein M3Y54_19465, partial [Bacteroidota bacterium]|nr:hypothetical protein [Bacteroidota bacterium]
MGYHSKWPAEFAPRGILAALGQRIGLAATDSSNGHPQFRMTIRPMEARYWPQVRAIYEAGLATGQASFATRVLRGPAWHKAHLPHSRLVALQPGDRVLGWAALAPAPGPYASAGVALPSLY